MPNMASRVLSARQAEASSSPAPDNKTVWAISVIAVAAILVAVGIAGFVAFRMKKRKFRQHQRLDSQSDSESQNVEVTREVGNTPGTRRNSTFNSNRLSVRSIRSIISLPAYHEQPRETEEIIARAGDREGLDYIIEGPETAEEVESQRQEEMAAIFRVQQTRRRELEERAERRRARRVALDRQDYREVARLDRLAAEARRRQRNGSQASLALDGSAVAEGVAPSSGDLIAELQQIRSRPRKISEVSYKDLGRARHDGSRIRHGSNESDAAPLLEEPAAMGTQPSRNRSRASSVGSQNPTGRPITRERSRSRASRTGGTDDTEEMTRRLSDEGIPPEPPSYDDDLSVHGGDAPPYEDVSSLHAVETSIAGRPSEDQTDASHHETEVKPEDNEDEKDEDASSKHQPETNHDENNETHDKESGDKESDDTPSNMPPRLQTRNIVAPPAIEVVSATPVHTAPTTPTTSLFSSRREDAHK